MPKESKLKIYIKKRDFSRTTEPNPDQVKKNKSAKQKKPKAAKSKKLIYVIQEHHARRLHYDLRLEFNGVLKSWAVPKEPSMNPSEKRLAVQTEDHPIEYAKFHDTIPEGQYGAGKVKIWDNGNFELISYKKDKKIEINIRGRKLRGSFALIHFRPGTKNWLFFKMKSEKKIKKSFV